MPNEPYTALRAIGVFQSGLTGKTGLTVTCYVNGPDNANIVSNVGATAVDVTNQPGTYYYDLAASSVTQQGWYTFQFRTSDSSVNNQQPQAAVEVRPPAGCLYFGKASAGGTNTITLAGGVATDNYYKYSLVEIVGGTGAGQSARLIIDYVGSTKVATVQKNWTTTPDSTSIFYVTPFAVAIDVHSGIAAGGGASTITLQSIASAVDDLYKGLTIGLFSGTGAGQAATIKSYVGSTKVATLNKPWATQPDNTSVYMIGALGPSWGDIYQWNGTAVATPNTAGVPVVDLARVLGTLLTETLPGYLAAGIKKFFNVVTPTSTMNEITLVDTVTNITNSVTAVVSDFTGNALALLNSILAYAKGIGVSTTPTVVAVSGLTTITAGSSYSIADGNPLTYDVTGLPALATAGQPAYWHGSNKTGGNLKVTGTIVTATAGAGQVRFELTAAQSRQLKSGVFALYANSANANPLITPNNQLVVNDPI